MNKISTTEAQHTAEQRCEKYRNMLDHIDKTLKQLIDAERISIMSENTCHTNTLDFFQSKYEEDRVIKNNDVIRVKSKLLKQVNQLKSIIEL